MFTAPTGPQISRAAASIGLSLSQDELRLYERSVTDQLRRLDDFVQSRTPEEDPPPVRFAERDLGYKPTEREDPYGAWFWKCDIGGSDTGLLAGMKIGVKDHISVRGIPQCFASYSLSNVVPDFDATVVTRVLDAGGKIVGKNSFTGLTMDYEPARNPHDAMRSAGGSSSGSCVAVAVGDADISFGGDQGGSIRIPAAYCGVIGMKPSFGVVSHFGAAYDSDQSLDHIGPIARRVEDIARALEVVAGYDRYDPRQRREVPERLQLLRELEGGVPGLRIGVLLEGFDEPMAEGVRVAVMGAVDRLASACGASSVTTVSVPAHRRVTDVYAALAIEGSRSLMEAGLYGAWSKSYYPTAAVTSMYQLWHDELDRFPPATKIRNIVAVLSRGVYRGAVYTKAQNVRPSFVRAYDSALAEVDLLVMPTIRDIPPRLSDASNGHEDGNSSKWSLNDWIYEPHTFNTKPFNYTGHPALAIPCGKIHGLPVSLQLVGRMFDDLTLLKAAFAYQESVDWSEVIRVGA